MFDRRTGVSLLKGRVMSKGDYAPSTCNLLRFGCGQLPHLQATCSWHSHTAAWDLYFLWAQLCAPCPGTRSPARAEPPKKRDGEPKPRRPQPPVADGRPPSLSGHVGLCSARPCRQQLCPRSRGTGQQCRWCMATAPRAVHCASPAPLLRGKERDTKSNGMNGSHLTDCTLCNVWFSVWLRVG